MQGLRGLCAYLSFLFFFLGGSKSSASLSNSSSSAPASNHCNKAFPPSLLYFSLIVCIYCFLHAVFESCFYHFLPHRHQYITCHRDETCLVGLDFGLSQQECFADLLVTQLRQLVVAQAHALLKKHCGPYQKGHEASLLCVLTHHGKTECEHHRLDGCE